MSKKWNIALLLGIIFVSMNLRAPITSVGPLVGIISENLNLSGGQSGLITTIPLISFAIVSPMAPKLANRFQTERTIFTALLVLIIGLLLRTIPTVPGLFSGTIIVGCAIAICNVLIPSLIKKEFSEKSGLVTGLFSVSMNLTGAISSGLSIPLVENFGLTWNKALGIWVILAIIALISWSPQLKRHDKPTENETQIVKVSLWHSPLAWSVTAFMGLQSFIFYVIVAWLPEMLVGQGLSRIQAGGMLSLLQFTILPTTFIVPIIAQKAKNQRLFVAGTALFFALGMLGLMSSQSSLIVILACMSIGIGGGAAFSLAMMFFNLRTRNAQEAAELSGMAQSMGYILAAVGPFLFGVMHDQTGNWQFSLVLLLLISIALLFTGLKAGKNEVIGQ